MPPFRQMIGNRENKRPSTVEPRIELVRVTTAKTVEGRIFHVDPDFRTLPEKFAKCNMEFPAMFAQSGDSLFFASFEVPK